MSGLFKNQQVLGCSSCNGMGETTAEDIQRWQNGEFTWSDWAWCKANFTTLLGAVTSLPLMAIGLWQGGGRERMHPNVPSMFIDVARVWPCVSETDQKKANQKAAAVAPVNPPSPTPPAPDEPIGPVTTKGRTQLLTTVAVVGLAALIFMNSRKKAKKFDSLPTVSYKSRGFRERKRRRRTNR